MPVTSVCGRENITRCQMRKYIAEAEGDKKCRENTVDDGDAGEIVGKPLQICERLPLKSSFD